MAVRSSNYVGTFKKSCERDMIQDKQIVDYVKQKNEYLKSINASWRIRIKRRGRGPDRLQNSLDTLWERWINYPYVQKHLKTCILTGTLKKKYIREAFMAWAKKRVSQDFPVSCAKTYDMYAYRVCV